MHFLTAYGVRYDLECKNHCLLPNAEPYIGSNPKRQFVQMYVSYK